MKLYEIADDYKDLELMIDRGDLTVEMAADTLELIESDFNSKAESVCFVLKNMEAEITAIRNEITRLKEREQRTQQSYDYLSEYLKINMVKIGLTTIKFDLFTLSKVSGRDVVEIIDKSKVPDIYLNVRITTTPDKKQILKNSRLGEEIPGVNIKKSDAYIKIK